MSSESCGLSYLAQRGGTARGRVRFSRLKTRCTIRLSISSSRRSQRFLSLRDVSLLLCLDSSSQYFQLNAIIVARLSRRMVNLAAVSLKPRT